MKRDKLDRDSEQKGLKTGLIAKPPLRYWSAADGIEVYLEKNVEYHRDLVRLFKFKAMGIWPAEVFYSLYWLVKNREMLRLLRL